MSHVQLLMDYGNVSVSPRNCPRGGHGLRKVLTPPLPRRKDASAVLLAICTWTLLCVVMLAAFWIA